MENKNKSLVENGSLFYPSADSTLAGNMDLLFYFILLISIIFTALIIGAAVYFAFKFKRSKNNLVAKKQVEDNHKLEFAWTFIPFVIVMVIFFWGFRDYLLLTIAPDDAMEIRVTAEKWYWSYQYPDYNAESVGDLYVPVGQPVKLVMSSKDVLHSYYIPNFRVKRDVLPNRYSNLWFEATEPGSYQVLCTEYCGDAHSNMLSNLHVLPYTDFVAKLDELAAGDDLPMYAQGERLYKKHGCFACHSIDGTAMVGPTWYQLYGKNRVFVKGDNIKADDNYIRESIVYPGNKIVKGYQNVMNSYAGLLEDDEITAIIEYIKTLK